MGTNRWVIAYNTVIGVVAIHKFYGLFSKNAYKSKSY